jgi:cytoskeletal protein RodZ
MDVLAQIPVDLVAIRQQRGLSLEQISNLTKIRKSWLQAIEEGRWSELPGGIYRRSYIRQYAQATGVNERELLECCPLHLLMEA